MNQGYVSLLSSPTEHALRFIPGYDDKIWFETGEVVLFNMVFHKCEWREGHDERIIFAKTSSILLLYDRLRLMKFIRQCAHPILSNIILNHILLTDIVYDDAVNIMAEYLDTIDIILIIYGPNAEIRDAYAKHKLWNDVLRKKFPFEPEVENAGESLIIRMGVNHHVLDIIIRNELFLTDVMSVVERVVVVDGKNPFYVLINKYMMTRDTLLRHALELWRFKLTKLEYTKLLGEAMDARSLEYIQMLIDNIPDIVNFNFEPLINQTIMRELFDMSRALLLANQQIIDRDLYGKWVLFVRRDPRMLQLLIEMEDELLNGIGG